MNGIQTIATEGREPSQLDKLTAKLQEVNSRVEIVHSKAHTLLTRMRGSQPEEVQAEKSTPLPDGYSNNLNAQADNLGRNVEYILNTLNELESHI